MRRELTRSVLVLLSSTSRGSRVPVAGLGAVIAAGLAAGIGATICLRRHRSGAAALLLPPAPIEFWRLSVMPRGGPGVVASPTASERSITAGDWLFRGTSDLLHRKKPVVFIEQSASVVSGLEWGSTMTATNHDDQLGEIYPTMLNELNCTFGVSLSRFHCCGRHGIGPLELGLVLGFFQNFPTTRIRSFRISAWQDLFGIDTKSDLWENRNRETETVHHYRSSGICRRLTVNCQ